MTPTHGLTFGTLYNTRQNNFNLLRLVLATLVVLSHSFPVLWPPSRPFEPLSFLSRGHFTFGTLSVNAFLVISGFLIAASWEHSRSVWDFARRRILRVVPGYAVCVLVCAFVVGPLSNGNTADYFARLRTYSPFAVLTLQSLPGVFPHNAFFGAMNVALWTVRYEMYCYVLLALWGLVTGLRRSFVLAGFLFCYLGYNVAVPLYESRFGVHEGILGGEFLPRLATYFFAGAVAWAYRDRIPLTLRHTLFFAIVLALGLQVLPHWLVPVGGTYCLLALAFSRRFQAYDFGKRVDLSYGVYLYAFPLQQLFAQWFGSRLHPVTLFLCVMPPLLLMAWGSWSWIEHPFLQFKQTRREPKTA